MINEAVNSAGTGGGSALKYALKLPNRLTVRFAAGSSVNTSRSAARGLTSQSEVVDAFIVR